MLCEEVAPKSRTRRDSFCFKYARMSRHPLELRGGRSAILPPLGLSSLRKKLTACTPQFYALVSANKGAEGVPSSGSAATGSGGLVWAKATAAGVAGGFEVAPAFVGFAGADATGAGRSG